jgi:hypothetical protein
VSMDLELEAWRRDWAEESPGLPALKARILRQERRMVGGGVALLGLALFATAAAVRTGRPFVAGLAAGLWCAGLLVGGYTYRALRGAWRPSAETTRAYLELSYKRAVAKARTLRFSIQVLVATTVLYGGLIAWRSAGAGPRPTPWVPLLLLAEVFWLRRRERQKGIEAEETRRLLDETSEESGAGERE